MNSVTITEHLFEELRQRFCLFCDAVVDDVSINFAPEKKVILVLAVKDNQAESGWSKVVFEVHDFDEFKFCYGRHTFEVLSSGMQVFWKVGGVHLFLDAYPDDPEMPDTGSNFAYVVGKKLIYRDLQEPSTTRG